MQTAKLFQNYRSQAVRRPKTFRFEGQVEVCIERDGDRVILSLTRKPSIESCVASLSAFDAVPDRNQPLLADSRRRF